jgi:hypothetical protein
VLVAMRLISGADVVRHAVRAQQEAVARHRDLEEVDVHLALKPTERVMMLPNLDSRASFSERIRLHLLRDPRVVLGELVAPAVDEQRRLSPT